MLKIDFLLFCFVSGGVRRAMACISGHNVFMRMKFEGGVHRVQRVPRTEKSGRVHTSTATVAVMARPSEVTCCLINNYDVYTLKKEIDQKV